MHGELFPFGDDTKDDEIKHLARVTALLGPPPQELIHRGRRSFDFYESNGQFSCSCISLLPILICSAGPLKNPDMVPTNFNFDTVINNIHSEDKRMFIEFLKRMIKWRPEERSTAKELLDDPWLYADFP